jgi:hypothetical protein
MTINRKYRRQIISKFLQYPAFLDEIVRMIREEEITRFGDCLNCY